MTLVRRSAGFLVALALVTACEKKRESHASLAQKERERQARLVIPDLTEPEHAPPPTAPPAPEAPSPDAIRKLHAEPIAGVNLGMTDAQVTKILGAPTNKSAIAALGNTKNEFGMTWTWPTMKAELAGATKKGPFTLRSITFLRASKVKTSRGVGIGSTRAEIASAYAGLEDPIFAKDTRMFVVGASTSYGMNGISFNFRDDDRDGNLETDRVKEIEWAGGAEQ
ncbi:MAG TPA: hypothetical protein VMZ53_10155 [Kofleriaceae bacterium]|nr:hypothetical protein [Kofleriaceae bacterium]